MRAAAAQVSQGGTGPRAGFPVPDAWAGSPHLTHPEIPAPKQTRQARGPGHPSLMMKPSSHLKLTKITSRQENHLFVAAPPVCTSPLQ